MKSKGLLLLGVFALDSLIGCGKSDDCVDCEVNTSGAGTAGKRSSEPHRGGAGGSGNVAMGGTIVGSAGSAEAVTSNAGRGAEQGGGYSGSVSSSVAGDTSLGTLQAGAGAGGRFESASASAGEGGIGMSGGTAGTGAHAGGGVNAGGDAGTGGASSSLIACDKGTFSGGVNATNFEDAVGYTAISGSVDFSGFDTLTPLRCVTTIGGDLVARQYAVLANFNGFEQLTSIGGSFIVNSPANLTSVAALSSLETIGGELFIGSSLLLTSLSGLERLASVGGGVLINKNARLSNVESLNGLKTIGGRLLITENGELTSLKGFEKITKVQSLTIGDNIRLASIEGLSALSSVELDLSIYGNSKLASVTSLISLTSVSRKVTIVQNALLPQCDVCTFFQQLGAPGGSVSLAGNRADSCSGTCQ